MLHIDYEKASSVVQRFGDVKRLISQTLDPILTAYFRDVAQSSSMLDLLTHRDEIQKRATEELGRRFKDYDINCVAVLIGRPEFRRWRRGRLIRLSGCLTSCVSLAFGRGAEGDVCQAGRGGGAVEGAERGAGDGGEADGIDAVAHRRGGGREQGRGAIGGGHAAGQARRGAGRRRESRSKGVDRSAAGVADRWNGLSEAAVFLQKIRAYGDSRLFALNLVAEQFSKSAQPIVPDRVLLMGGGKDGEGAGDLGSVNLLSQVLALLLGEKAGIGMAENSPGLESLDAFTKEITKRVNEPQAEAGNGHDKRN